MLCTYAMGLFTQNSFLVSVANFEFRFLKPKIRQRECQEPKATSFEAVLYVPVVYNSLKLHRFEWCLSTALVCRGTYYGGFGNHPHYSLLTFHQFWILVHNLSLKQYIHNSFITNRVVIVKVKNYSLFLFKCIFVIIWYWQLFCDSKIIIIQKKDGFLFSYS